jgi:DNA-binding transcriptional LysR family regulator
MESVSDDLQLFLGCLREGSLTRVARTLGTTVSTASRRLDRLEERLGRALFLRNSDGLVALPAADKLRDAAEAAERVARDLDASARCVDDVSGIVTLATTRDLAEFVIIPNLVHLLRRHPRLVVELEVGTPLVDLARREADLALRVGTPGADDRMVARRLRETPLAVYVARSLWTDPPPDPRDLPWIDASRLAGPLSGWGRHLTGRDPALRIEDLGLMQAAAAAGLGLALLPDVYGAAVPSLVEVARPSQIPPSAIYLVAHPSGLATPRVRAVWNFLIEWVGGDADRDREPLRSRPQPS